MGVPTSTLCMCSMRRVETMQVLLLFINVIGLNQRVAILGEQHQVGVAHRVVYATDAQQRQ